MLPLALLSALGITAALAVFGVLARANAPKDGPDQRADDDCIGGAGLHWTDDPIARGNGRALNGD